MNHEHHPLLMIATPLLAAWHFLSSGLSQLAAYGLTWQTAAALLAGAGSVLIGASGVSRELREWLDRRSKRRAAAVAAAALPEPHS